MSQMRAIKAGAHPYVERKKKVCGGRPVIRDTLEILAIMSRWVKA